METAGIRDDVVRVNIGRERDEVMEIVVDVGRVRRVGVRGDGRVIYGGIVISILPLIGIEFWVVKLRRSCPDSAVIDVSQLTVPVIRPPTIVKVLV